MCFGFGPVVDGTILPREPIEMMKTGDYKKCSLLSGITSEDGALFIANSMNYLIICFYYFSFLTACSCTRTL